jgi:hypothetical protein
VLRQRGRRYLRLLSLGCFGRRLSFRLRRGMDLGADAIFMLLSEQDFDVLFAPCRPAAGPQAVPVAPSSPSRTRSPEPLVTGEALVDDARTTTPTRGVAEGVTTSPSVTDTRAGSSLNATEGVETSAGGVGATTSPTVVDVDPIRVVPDGARDVAEDQPQIDLASGGPEVSGAQVPPSSTSSLRLPRRSINWDHTP